MAVHLHLLNADGQLSSLGDRILACLEECIRDVTDRVSLPSVDFVISADTRRVISEIGVGGHTVSPHQVALAVDPDNDAFARGFEASLKRMLAHELHHCARWLGVGYGTTLGEALVSEGLACMFETEVYPGAVPSYARGLTPRQLNECFALALRETASAGYDHAAWFFGHGANALPRHAGYSIGYALVVKYLQAKGGDAGRLVTAPATDFLF